MLVIGGLVVGEDRVAPLGGRGPPPCARLPAGPQPRVDDQPAGPGANPGASQGQAEEYQREFHLSPSLGGCPAAVAGGPQQLDQIGEPQRRRP